MKIMKYFPVLAFCLMAAGCGSKKGVVSEGGVDFSNLDKTALPGTDFYQYACGGWMKNHPLTDEYARFGSFDMLAENNRKQVRELIEELSKSKHGPNRITALPMEVPVCYQEVAHCLEKSISKIETAILSALENTPPELYADIVHNGIYLAGGGALLRGLDKRLTDKINIPFHIAEDPLHGWLWDRLVYSLLNLLNLQRLWP